MFCFFLNHDNHNLAHNVSIPSSGNEGTYVSETFPFVQSNGHPNHASLSKYVMSVFKEEMKSGADQEVDHIRKTSTPMTHFSFGAATSDSERMPSNTKCFLP